MRKSLNPGESPQPPLRRGAISPKVPLLKGDLGGLALKRSQQNRIVSSPTKLKKTGLHVDLSIN
jgi:hypothetical protein